MRCMLGQPFDRHWLLDLALDPPSKRQPVWKAETESRSVSVAYGSSTLKTCSISVSDEDEAGQLCGVASQQNPLRRIVVKIFAKANVRDIGPSPYFHIKSATCCGYIGCRFQHRDSCDAIARGVLVFSASKNRSSWVKSSCGAKRKSYTHFCHLIRSYELAAKFGVTVRRTIWTITV